jgi:amino acid transporter
MTTPANSSNDDVRTRDDLNQPTGANRNENASVASPAASYPTPPGRREVVARQREEFGGMKFGSAFFGWLAATGLAVILTALVAGAGTALSVTNNVNTTNASSGTVQTIGLAGAIILLVIIFISYFCGGYVAGRMARFNGLKQGVAVWLWAVVVAIVVAILAAIAGTQFNVLASLNALPRIPVKSDTLTTAGVLTAIGVVVVSLVGAILGGLAGMRFHRRVDRVGLEA